MIILNNSIIIMKTVIFLFALMLAVSGTNIGSAHAQSTCPNYAMLFDGVNDAIRIAGFPTTDEMTIEFWFYWDPNSAGTYAILSSLDDETYYGYRINNDGYRIRMESEIGVTARFGSFEQGPQWYHLAITFEPYGTFYFINGQGYDENNGFFLSGDSFLESFPSTLHIGAGVGATNFRGMIDELRIWNTIRTAQQIRDNMHSRLVGNESGLVAYYPFDEGSGTSTTDASIGSNNGTLQNGTAWVETDLVITGCPDCTNPFVSTQPADEIVFTGDDATFTTASDDDNSPQWQLSTNGGQNWSDISGATSGTLSVSNVTMSMNGYRYRAAFTNDCGTSYSDEATLTVKVHVTDLGPVDLCIGSSSNSNNGCKIDLLVELFKNNVKIIEGSVLNQQVTGNSNNDLSKKNTIALPQLPSGVEFAATDILKCRVSVRRSGGTQDFPLRLWYNGSASSSSEAGLKAWSRIHKETEGSSADYYYLRSNDNLIAGAGTGAEYKTVTAQASYQVFGEWSVAGASMKKGATSIAHGSKTEFTAQLISEGNLRKLRFTSPEGIVTMSLFDVTGREVRTFAPIVVSDGSSHETTIHHSGLASGIYTLIISNGAIKESIRFPVIR